MLVSNNNFKIRSQSDGRHSQDRLHRGKQFFFHELSKWEFVNLSLSTGRMPNALKVAALSPSLKKPDADFKQFSNFRPISNLTLVSKIIEKAVAEQLTDHVKTYQLDGMYQSAFKALHSTETALLKVQNDILRAVDDNKSVILLLLDLSSAFDTVDHLILLSRLSHRFGIKGNALLGLTRILNLANSLYKLKIVIHHNVV